MEFNDRIRSKVIRLLYDYWTALLRERPIPTREDIDPRRLPEPVIPHLGLFDVEHDPRRYRVRLMGANIVAWYGCDVTGRYLDEIDLGPDPGPGFAILDHVVRCRTPAHMMGEYTKQDGRHIRYERLVLPLSSGGQEVGMLLGASDRLSDQGTSNPKESNPKRAKGA
ncbi:PAS domain-containing protein [Pelagibius sp.]|uniref:PAS domain-containing protein n=1 Tax=Pelagibius sp. TaxID=1931238 RepID=UPI003BB0943B